MPKIGEFDCASEIGTGDLTFTYAATRAGARRKEFVVKVLDLDGESADPGSVDRRKLFTGAAAAQQQAYQSGCRGIAPIEATGEEASRLYVAMPRYTRSVATLIRGRVLLRPAAIERIVGGVLKTLQDLALLAGRAHGNLKPSNVFIHGARAEAARIVLSDLPPMERDGGYARDLRALGTMLFQLVRARPVAVYDWPLQMGEEWKRLGNDAERWIEFCNLLLNPDLADSRESLDRALASFRALGGRAGGQGVPRLGTGFWWIAGTAAALVLGGGVLWVKMRADWRSLCEEYPEAEAIGAEKANWMDEDDPHLVSLAPPDPSCDPARIYPGGWKQGPPVTDVATWWKVEVAAGRVRSIWEAMQPGEMAGWIRLKQVQDDTAAFVQNGWTAAAAELKNAVPNGTASSITATLRAATTADEILRRWGDIERSYLQPFAQSGDPFLQKVASVVSQELATELASDGLDALDRTLNDPATLTRHQLDRLAAAADDLANERDGLDPRRVRELVDNKLQLPSDPASLDSSIARWLMGEETCHRIDDNEAAELLTPIGNDLQTLETAREGKTASPEIVKRLAGLESRFSDLKQPVEAQRRALAELEFDAHSLVAMLGEAPPAAGTSPGAGGPAARAAATPAASAPSPTPPPASRTLAQYLNLLKNLQLGAQWPPDPRLVGDFVEDSAALGEPAAGRAKALQAALTNILAPPVLPGWKFIPQPNGNPYSYVYGWPQDRPTVGIEFARVQKSDGSEFLISQYEMPVIYCVPWCKQFNVVPAAAAYSKEIALPWTFDNGQLKAKAPADEWLISDAYINHQLTNAWADPALARPPQGRWDLCPMTGLGADQASSIASQLGLRLPTLDEWNAVYQLQDAASWKGSANLRDHTWQSQKDHMDSVEARQAIPGLNWASTGGHSHSYQAGPNPPTISASTDGYVFFAPVNSQKGPEDISNFIGNAAEYVNDRGTYYAIGGSAISDPSAVDQKQPIKKDPEVCDVGFRLAADGISKTQSVQKWTDAIAREQADAPAAFGAVPH
jgi:hypothetical protein